MEELLTQLSRAYNHVDYAEFLNRTGFVDSTYALDKFMTFKEGCQKLLAFDSNTLESIISESKTLVNH